MITTQLMLKDLHRWVQAHATQVQQYLRGYPYANYLAIDATNLLRHTISDIVKHISTQVRASPLAALAKYSGSPLSTLSHR